MRVWSGGLGRREAWNHATRFTYHQAPVRLIAAEVYFDPNDENHCAAVGFRAADDGYFLLSRLLRPSEQDRRLGLDPVYAELSDQGFGCYGGIGSVSISPTALRFDLNEKGAEAMKRTFVEVVHDLPPHRSRQMRQVLAVVFDGFDRYADCG